MIARYDIRRLQARAWKNGGGATRTIVCRPAGASQDDFDWRVSIATIAADGDFSRYAGFDRCIALLHGGGVHLVADNGEIDHLLDVPHAPFSFDGGVALHATVLAGESEDFNVMTRRGRARASLRVMRDGCALRAAAGGLVHAVAGGWTLDGDARVAGTLEPGNGVWWDGAPFAGLRATPRDAGAVLYAVDIVAAGPGSAR